MQFIFVGVRSLGLDGVINIILHLGLACDLNYQQPARRPGNDDEFAYSIRLRLRSRVHYHYVARLIVQCSTGSHGDSFKVSFPENQKRTGRWCPSIHDLFLITKNNNHVASPVNYEKLCRLKKCGLISLSNQHVHAVKSYSWCQLFLSVCCWSDPELSFCFLKDDGAMISAN